MNERSYWNSNGEAQALYDEMQAAAFKYTKATGALFHSYHRYYNDGDLPGWAEPPGHDAIQPRVRIRPQCADRRGRGRI